MSNDRPVIIVGAGAAGLAAALTLTERGRPVVIVADGPLGGGSTAWAQGGLAAVIDPHDTFASHVADTQTAGAGLSDRDAVAELVAAAPAAIARLAALGAGFDTGPHGYALGLEGGHSARRIVHAGGDASGAAVAAALTRAALPRVESGLLQLRTATVGDLLADARGAICGVSTLDAAGRATALGACAVILATGGIGDLWASSTNPASAQGAGLALAARAGAVLMDLEFMQFHPTALTVAGRTVLISEAVRGEGATLSTSHGEPLMRGRHPLGDLAPRDVVAAAIHDQIERDGTGRVLLHATMIDDFESRFPTITAACHEAGIDPTSQPLPVRPAAHYHCGGVRADLWGRTSIDGLYAVGEVAATGVHGANRLASNSLTEAVVAGDRIGRLLAARPPQPGPPSSPATIPGAPARYRDSMRSAMSRYAGVARTGAGGLDALQQELGLPIGVAASVAEAETANRALVSRLVATAAANRTESRGCHRRTDYPRSARRWERHQLLVLDSDDQIRDPRREAAA